MDSDNKKSPENVSDIRRKLLIASAATPIVATLHSSAAMAASSAYQCAGGDFSNKKFEEHGESLGGDTAMRTAVPFYKQLPGNQQTKPDIKNEPKLNPNLYLIDDVLYDNGGKDYAYDSDSIAVLNSRYYQPETAYVLQVYSVGDTGNYPPEYLGVWPAVQLSGGVTALTASCWTSVGSPKGYL